ncbi:MAG: type II toxin-antitoxin system prevent-host-death family antitoxin [Actinomycetota bacterium]|nr:type II toxin-antitoxin system prevent-host-death family antitoxin [Actinomycetota bacterium]
MSRTVTATEAKAKLLALLEEVSAGEEVEITKHGRVLARLVPARGGRALEGSARRMASSAVEEELLFSTGERWNCE